MKPSLLATTVKLKLIAQDAAHVVFLGPFINFQEVLKLITPSIRGWGRGIKEGFGHEEISVTIEFNYGNYVYRDIHFLYPPSKGGTDATLFWLDYGVHEWLAQTGSAYLKLSKD